MSLDDSLKKIVEEYREDPRNKVFAPMDLLVESVAEETGDSVNHSQLNSIIEDYIAGTISGSEQDIYDGALFACGELARQCFGENPDDEDEEVDYQISWLQDDEGYYFAEIRPES